VLELIEEALDEIALAIERESHARRVLPDSQLDHKVIDDFNAKSRRRRTMMDLLFVCVG
jgi:hypothetical protein